MKQFQQKVQQQFNRMVATGKLFRSSIIGQRVWELYLNSFEKDPIFRDPNSSTHNCNLCNNFIRRYGNIVAISDKNEIMTLWDVEIEGEFAPVADTVSKAIHSAPIQDVFFETFTELNSLNYEKCSKTASTFRLGIDKNHKRYTREEAEKFGVVKPNEIRTFEHLHLDIPAAFVDQSGKSVEAIMGEYRDAKQVFQRGMEEIALDTLYLVKDLINQGSLLDGATHLYKIEQFISLKKLYDNDVQSNEEDNWCWVNSYNLPIAKFRNELIGTLCTELSEGKELNDAVRNWNKRVDPVNYMKATAPITKKQIEEARKFVEENGYEQSFDRRFATIDDIKVSEILHANAGDGKIKSVSIFDGVKSSSTRHKRSEFDRVEEVNIERFMKDILPTCSSVEVFLTGQMERNMVTLTTANHPDSKPIFKWNNNYSWTYNGNLAGKSQIKQAVKDAGGNVEGVLNFRLAWNEDGQDSSDLDLWAIEPIQTRIGYSTNYRKGRGIRGKDRSPSSGQLDVDIITPGERMAVENITWIDKSSMKEGIYKVWVNPFSPRNSKGFKVEIEFEGESYTYTYDRPVSKDVPVAEITLKNGQFTIKHILPATEGVGAQREIYGLETNQFHRVNLVCLSPNHWEGNNVGNKHYFFMLEGAKCPLSIRSFHNENLIPELLTHRKVMEVLANQTMIEPTEKQLSGIGLNATVNEEVIVRLQGTHRRVIKIKI